MSDTYEAEQNYNTSFFTSVLQFAKMATFLKIFLVLLYLQTPPTEAHTTFHNLLFNVN
jgi:hypothetical protein